jgi:hypothetical protein
MLRRDARTRTRVIGALSVVAGLGLAAGTALAKPPHEPTIDIFGTISEKVIHKSGPHARATRFVAPPAGSSSPNRYPITYHNGPVMSTLSQIVVIWYGNWGQGTGTDSMAGQTLIRDALFGLAAPPATIPTATTDYAGVTTGSTTVVGSYTQTGGTPVTHISSTNIFDVTQTVAANYGGYVLTDASVQALVSDVAKRLGPDPNAIYLVLSSSDVSESSGFLTAYCGWHTYSTVGATTVKYGFIGNPNKNLAACNVNTAGASPNGNPAVDAMISVIAHELEETVTDPLLNAWYNRQQNENGDMCAWTFGSKPQVVKSADPTTNGSYYNVTLPTPTAGGTRNYLIQRALARSNSKCYVSASGAQ